MYYVFYSRRQLIQAKAAWTDILMSIPGGEVLLAEKLGRKRLAPKNRVSRTSTKEKGLGLLETIAKVLLQRL